MKIMTQGYFAKDENSGYEVLNGSTGQPIQLAMQSLWLTGEILPTGARLIAVHQFRSGETQPLEAVYAFGLPRDAALRRFKITGENFQVASELKPVAEARKDYETGISEGHLSALAQTYRDGRVNLSVGNLRPGELVRVYLELVAGVDLRDDGLRFRFPFTLAPCYHAQARAVALEPGVGEIELPADQFGDILLPAYFADSRLLHAVSFDLSVAMGDRMASISSPSHTIKVAGLDSANARVTLNVERDVPDRDLVLDVRTNEAKPRVCGGVCGDGKARFNVVVPAKHFGQNAALPKSVVFILDHSGSMSGGPLEQAKKAVAACLAVLGDKDQFGLVAFESTVTTFERHLTEATQRHRERALKFLDGLHATGGTELAGGIKAGFEIAGSAQADLLVVTDGQVSATEDILAGLRGKNARLHCLGIGAASQDRFLTLLARETGGTSRFVTPRERVDMEALELFAGLGKPVAAGLAVTFTGLAGAHAVISPSSVFEGHPCVVMGEADTPGAGTLELAWDGDLEKKRLSIALDLTGEKTAETVRLLHGARLITDTETSLQGEIGQDQLSQRQNRRLQEKLEQLSRQYGLASRAMSLVAVVTRPGDDASKVPVTKVVPVGMPQDMAMASYFASAGAPMRAQAVQRLCCMQSSVDLSTRQAFEFMSFGQRDASSISDAMMAEGPAFFTTSSAMSLLMEHAARLLPDGGLPGDDEAARVFKSLALLVSLAQDGHGCHRGAFRLHVRRLVDYLKANLAKAPLELRETIQRIITKCEHDEPTQISATLEELLELCEHKAQVQWPKLAQYTE